VPIEFKHTQEIGANKAKQHEIELWVNNKLLAKTKGNNIKSAEQRAAEIACKQIKMDMEEE
jgi:dsRNA-specific ribonuclease